MPQIKNHHLLSTLRTILGSKHNSLYLFQLTSFLKDGLLISLDAIHNKKNCKLAGWLKINELTESADALRNAILKPFD